jgi:talin
LETGRSLEYFLLRNGDMLEYKKKARTLKIRMLDESLKTISVDDSHPVSQIMITICSKIGIANHDEYSLVRDLPEEEKEKTLTLRRADKDKTRDYKKMDEMRKKLHTDDDLNWLDHSKTLREQGIDPSETLLFRRKYFFSDQNVDVRDPVQLNLLYVQTRDAILKGAHPVDQEQATVFAGIQCQIQFGDHVESKHRPGFLDTKDFLPKEYMKIKGIEKRIFTEHNKYHGRTEVEAKAEYVRLARSLKTYGITFFLLKEKEVGKNKLVPRLLGITKENIVRVDEKTKKIIETWPLTSVKKWCATPNAFHLDFGDYGRSNYIGKTDEGEQIAQLVSGYIDIILKKKAAKDHFGIDGNEESTMFEDSVTPAKAMIVQHQSTKIDHANTGLVALPGVLRTGDTAESAHISSGSLHTTQFAQKSHLAHAGHRLSTVS